MKTSLLKANSAFEQFCQANSIVSERVNSNPQVLAYLVPESTKVQNKKITQFLAESARESALQFKTANLTDSKLYVLAMGTLSEESMSDLAGDIAACYTGLRSKLVKVLGETNLKSPNSALRRANSNNQFPASMQDHTKKKKANKAKDMDEKIEEALSGIATPDDSVQPQEGLKSLFSALKRSGLGQELKKVGVSWNVAEPGKHAVTFINGKVPILQLTSVELGDAKKLGEVLSQLTSIAQGKAPQAAELELNRVKEMAARANDRKSALDDIAQQFAVPDPEEQQQQLIAKPRV